MLDSHIKHAEILGGDEFFLKTGYEYEVIDDNMKRLGMENDKDVQAIRD
jgi:hypothetical protein